MTTAILISDVFSMFHKNNKREQLGKKGDKVILIAEHGDIWIVEGPNKKRFSSHKNNITYGNTEQNTKGEDPRMAEERKKAHPIKGTSNVPMPGTLFPDS